MWPWDERDEWDDNTADSNSFQFKSRLLNNTDGTGTVNVEISIPLKYLTTFSRTLQMPLINCEISLILSWSTNCIICEANRATTFATTDTKLYGPLATLLTQDNTKLLQQLKSGFKRTTNESKYQSKVSTQAQNQYLDNLIDPSFQGVNRFFALSFEINAVKTGYTIYFLPKREIKDYNVMI